MNQDFDLESAKALEHLEHELQAVRTGRANPAIVEDIAVEAYGTMTPLVQLAAISAPEPRLIVIQPWDPSVTKDIERALSQSSLGINPVVDGKVIRLPFPAMTEERRKEMQKVVNEKGESSRVRIRGIREELVKQLRKAEKDGELSEDIFTLEMKKLQDSVDAQLANIASIVEKKQAELAII